MDTRTALSQEWTTLQNNHERYESGALWIKLVAVLLFFTGAAIALEPWLLCLLLLVLWLQEGIFKTWQSRLGSRLLEVERLLAEGATAPEMAFQLHTGWAAGRKGSTALLAEYLASACRPTVAFPHLVLVLLALVFQA
jgi:hypothetical protein